MAAPKSSRVDPHAAPPSIIDIICASQDRVGRSMKSNGSAFCAMALACLAAELARLAREKVGETQSNVTLNPGAAPNERR